MSGFWAESNDREVMTVPRAMLMALEAKESGDLLIAKL